MQGEVLSLNLIHKLTHCFSFGYCPSSNFLKKHDVLKTSYIFICRQRST